MKPRPLTKAQIKAAADRAEGKAAPTEPKTPDDMKTVPKPAAGPKKKKKRGRPTVYRPAMAAEIKILCERGATDLEVADFLNVDVSTVQRWAHKHAEFCIALAVGKEAADTRVERSLYHKAVGYTYDAEEVFVHQGNVTRVNVRKQFPPSEPAANLWLKNRKPDEWRDRSNVAVTANVSITDGKTAEQMLLEMLAEMKALGVTPEMLALPDLGKMIDVSEGVANLEPGKSGK